jgi:parallel beta-helix repeat protein
MSIRVARYFLAFMFLAINLSGTVVLGAGQTFYVTSTGNDSNSCSQTLPCRQIRRAIELVGPGDTVLVANGTYKGFNVANHHGLAGSPITIKAQGTSAVIAKTTDRSDNRDTIFITHSSYIVVDGLRSSGANRAAMRIDWSPHVTVRNCVFGNNTTWGIFTDFSDDLLLENNEAYGSGSQHGIYVSNSGDRPIVRGNRLHDNRLAGVQLNADLSSGGDGIITGALVENNVIYNNGAGGGAAINADGLLNSIFRNNLIYNNRATGIAIYKSDGALGPKGNKVYHNTIYQASTGRWALLIWRSGGINTLRNNILYHPSATKGGINYLSEVDVNNTDSDYNVLDRVTPNDSTVYSLAQWKGLGNETHSFSASPTSLFVNAAGFDFRLAAASPAINRGLTLPDVTKDIVGNARPVGAASDIGAYEAGTATPVLSVTTGSLAFGTVSLGLTKDLTLTVKNAGGGTLTGLASTTAPFSVVGTASYSLAANQTKVVTVRFSPTVASAFSRTLSLTGGGGASVSLSGTGASGTPLLSVTPASQYFGSVNIGSSTTRTFTIKNAGSGTLTGGASTLAPFSVVGTASYSLAPNQTKVLTVRFAPTTLGKVGKKLTLTGGGGKSVGLTGTGVTSTGVLSVTPTSQFFGYVKIGSSNSLTFTLKNVGSSTFTVAASTVAPFSVVGTASYSLAPNQTQILTVRFAPTTLGKVGKTLTLTGGGGKSVALTGTGVAP